ncbi:MAG: T9SS type A sorting domain-containing protein [Bacteroidetes bacterium]|nr:T9SS type A sorting domain-containing protein [Bacteroidota bacterium]
MKKIFILILFLAFQKQFAQNLVCFTTPQPAKPVGSSMKSWMVSNAKADFNNDGIDDIFSATVNGIALLQSNGTGSFSSDTILDIGLTTGAVLTGDFNNDGRADIAATVPDSNKVAIILGTGTGTILSVFVFSVGLLPCSLASGDFNNDAKIDLAIANYSSNTVSIYKGVGNGTFTFLTNYNVGVNPSILIAGDFNNNGNLDLMVNSTNASYILKGNGAGLFAVSTFSNLLATNLITRDVTADGNLDVLYTHLNDSLVYLAKGNGNYTFLPAISYSLSHTNGYHTLNGLYADDFNNDGKMDFICASTDNSTFISHECYLEIFNGQGSGNFTGPSSFSVSSTGFQVPFGFIPVDANNDSKLDIVVALDNAGIIEILYNCNTVGVIENSEDKYGIALYPNPTSDIINISFDLETEIKKVEIFNDFGQLIHQEIVIFKDNGTVINTKELPNGVYHLTLRQAQGYNTVIATKQFVISRYLNSDNSN